MTYEMGNDVIRYATYLSFYGFGFEYKLMGFA